MFFQKYMWFFNVNVTFFSNYFHGAHNLNNLSKVILVIYLKNVRIRVIVFVEEFLLFFDSLFSYT